VSLLVHELRYPATTDAKALVREFENRHDKSHMTVVFSTYHSIDVLSEAQHDHGLPGFDLIICDEAHRTTGATFADEDESNFVKVHDAKFLLGSKRLYMTATPRIYADSAKAMAERDSVALCSMDDPPHVPTSVETAPPRNLSTDGRRMDRRSCRNHPVFPTVTPRRRASADRPA
jgi:predicted helicase